MISPAFTICRIETKAVLTSQRLLGKHVIEFSCVSAGWCLVKLEYAAAPLLRAAKVFAVTDPLFLAQGHACMHEGRVDEVLLHDALRAHVTVVAVAVVGIQV